MLRIEEKSACSGCGACRDICPVNAITLVADEEGFLYPKVDRRNCIECGRCVSVCAVAAANREEYISGNAVAYAAYTKNEPLRLESSSGGVFSELAQAILSMDGVVFGAAFDEKFVVKHICVDRAEDLNKLRGSKYVQSETGETYLQTKEYLEQGRPVLYSGTPCQISGLLRFLGRPYENLYTQDIICHGVPSPKIWNQYVRFRQDKTQAGIKNISFRAKVCGWRTFCMRVRFENGEEYTKNLQQDLYMRSFLKDLSLRPSCYSCAFKTKHRTSDITLADFWGVEKVCPEMDDDKGTSLVIVHSTKGQALFDRIKENLVSLRVDLDEAIRYNSAMTVSVAANPKREAFIREVNKKGFSSAKKYVRIPLIQHMKRFAKSILGK